MPILIITPTITTRFEYDDSDKCNGMGFEMIVKPVNDGGTAETDSTGIAVKKCDLVNAAGFGCYRFQWV